MNKKKVLEVFRRYLNSLEDQHSNIGENTSAVLRWLEENAQQPLMGETRTQCLYEAVQAIQNRGISCKRQAGSTWDGNAVKKFYKVLDNLSEAFSQGDDERCYVLGVTLGKLMYSATLDAPWLGLYMWLCYSRSKPGSWLADKRKMTESFHQIVEELEREDDDRPSESDARLSAQAKIVEASKEE